MSKKGKSNQRRSCQSIPSFLKTDYIQLKTSYKDESASLRKQLNLNKFPFYGDKLSGKFVHGEEHRRQHV